MSSAVFSPVADKAAWEQVERILRSQALRHSETHQRLLRYLTQKSLCGEADLLKEYVIGVDVFGKGTEYDPRQDSGVRIQVGRLRLKLADYYSSEGVNDPIIITLPKGRFKLLFEERLSVAPAPGQLDQPVEKISQATKPDSAPWRTAACLLAAALLLIVVWGIWSNVASRRLAQSVVAEPAWTPAAQEFWSPFVITNRPLLIVVATPLFVGFRGMGAYRDMNNNEWSETENASGVKAIRRAFGNPDIFPVRSYAGFGEAKSAVILGTFLSRHARNIRFVRSIDLSPGELSENNVIFLGGTKTFGQVLRTLPGKTEMMLEPTGLRILSRSGGGSEFVPDAMIGGSGSGLSSLPDDGVVNALIGIIPGPNGEGFVGTFLSNLNTGILAAVEYATKPDLLQQLAGKLKDRSGRLPRYFQVALQVTFKGGVPISSRYSLHREVLLDSKVPGK